jgi:CheY-like chemotaxis protein
MPLKVVIVDDAPFMLRLVCHHVASMGLSVEECSSGTLAWECIENAEPDLVILDVQMPDVDGIDIFLQMRTHRATRHIPVIFLTADDEPLHTRVPDFEQQGALLLSKLDLARLPCVVQQAVNLEQGTARSRGT